MRFVGRKKAALIAALFFLFPSLLAAQSVYVPKGWKSSSPAADTVTIFKPNATEGVSFRFIPYSPGRAVEQLHTVVRSLKAHIPDLHVLSVKADRSGRMAECELSYTGMDNSGTRPVKRRDKLLLITSTPKARTLLVLSYSSASLYGASSKLLEKIVKSAFAPPPRRAAARENAHHKIADLSRIRTKTVGTGIYWIEVPAGWRVTRAADGNFQAFSPKRDTVFIYALQIPADRQTYQYEMEGERMMGASPHQLDVLSRLAAPYMAPADIIRVYYPKVFGGEIRQMEILGARDVSSQSRTGARQGIIHYRYMLQTATGFVPVEGSSYVITIPPQYHVPGANFWTLIFQGAEAPPAIFRKNVPLYLAMFRSVKADQKGIEQKMEENAQASRIAGQMGENSVQSIARRSQMIGQTFQNMGAMQRQEFDTFQSGAYHEGLGWMETYGGETPVIDTQTGARTTLPSSYVDFFQNRGENVRASNDASAPGVYGGDTLQPVPAGSW